jgi:endoglucanase
MRGINLAGMEGGYGVLGADGDDGRWDQALGPREGQDYPVFTDNLVDYYRSKGIGVIRLFFSWERVQSELFGPVPATGARYLTYFNQYSRVVDHATSLGVVVIIEPWQANADGGVGGASWRGQPIGPGGVDADALADLWSKLASIFKGNPLVEYGLVNEPNNMSTMLWWETAQTCVDAIRGAGATSTVYVPGNGWTGAGTWTADWYDTAVPARSNAYGWLNANGAGKPLSDPLGKTQAEVHLYLDADASGNSDTLVSTTIAPERLSVTVDEAAVQGYQVFVAEIGLFAGEPAAPTAWGEFITYLAAHARVCTGFAWWAGGEPVWWHDLHGPHFSVSPTDEAVGVYSGDTVNMQMIYNDF